MDIRTVLALVLVVACKGDDGKKAGGGGGAVVATDDAVLVASADRALEVRALTEILRAQGKEDLL